MDAPIGEILGQFGVAGAVLYFCWLLLNRGGKLWREENQERRAHEDAQTSKLLTAQENRERAYQEAAARREEVIEARLARHHEDKREDRAVFTQATDAFKGATEAFRDAIREFDHHKNGG